MKAMQKGTASVFPLTPESGGVDREEGKIPLTGGVISVHLQQYTKRGEDCR